MIQLYKYSIIQNNRKETLTAFETIMSFEIDNCKISIDLKKQFFIHEIIWHQIVMDTWNIFFSIIHADIRLRELVCNIPSITTLKTILRNLFIENNILYELVKFNLN